MAEASFSMVQTQCSYKSVNIAVSVKFFADLFVSCRVTQQATSGSCRRGFDGALINELFFHHIFCVALRICRNLRCNIKPFQFGTAIEMFQNCLKLMRFLQMSMSFAAMLPKAKHNSETDSKYSSVKYNFSCMWTFNSIFRFHKEQIITARVSH